jgi:hypothetical protein
MKNTVVQQQQKQSKNKYSRVKFVIAPSIPGTELDALEKSWRNGDLLTLNYDVYVKELGFYSEGGLSAKPLITAPGIPTSEVKALKRRIKRAIRDQKNNVIFTNFDVNVQVV